jgi:hypothetical protein
MASLLRFELQFYTNLDVDSYACLASVRCRCIVELFNSRNFCHVNTYIHHMSFLHTCLFTYNSVLCFAFTILLKLLLKFMSNSLHGPVFQYAFVFVMFVQHVHFHALIYYSLLGKIQSVCMLTCYLPKCCMRHDDPAHFTFRLINEIAEIEIVKLACNIGLVLVCCIT